MNAGRECCAVCGSGDWKDAIWTGSRLICRPCHNEIRNHQRQAARRRFGSAPGISVPPTQQTLASREPAKPREVLHG
jgi:hypothetical protein